MASLENHASALQDQLIPGLQFSLGSGSSYVTARNNISIYPQGSNSYSSSGTKVCRIAVNADTSWIDPMSAYLFFKVTNKTSSPADTSTVQSRVEPLCGPHGFIKTIKMMCQGQMVEQIDMNGRLT